MTSYRYLITPRVAAPTSVPAMMVDVLVALLPALAMAVYLFGTSVLWLSLGSMTTCVMIQWIYDGVFKRKKQYIDPSPWVTGLLLSFCFPSDIAWWAVPAGCLFAIVVVKELYGGFACNFVNPALAGRMFLASSPLLMTRFSQPLPMVEAGLVDAITSATPMAYLQQGTLPEQSINELFLGFHAGSFGEVSALMLLLGGIYLLARRVITPIIPLSFLGSVALLTFCFPQGGQDPFLWMMAQLCSGGLMLAAFFMATDPVTSPVSPRGQLFFGVGCGVFTVLLRYYGSYPEGVGYAILLMNCLVWLLDRLGAPRRFGEAHFSGSKRVFSAFSQQIRSIRISLPKKKKADGSDLTDLLTTAKSETDANTNQDTKPRTTGTAPLEGHLDQVSSTTKCVVMYGLVLAVTIGGIWAVYDRTLLAVHRNTEAYNLELLEKAMPNATFMSETPFRSPDFSKLYTAYENHEEVGYCVEVSAIGFHDSITLLVGIDLSGAVTGIAVVDHSETLRIGESVFSEEVLSRFYGRSGTLRLSGNNGIDGVSGATVTMDAVVMAVNKALSVVQLIDQVGALELLDDVL